MIFQTKNAPGMVSGYSTSRERPVVLSDGIVAEERKGDVAGPEFAEIAGFFGMMLPSTEVSKTKTYGFFHATTFEHTVTYSTFEHFPIRR